MNSEIVKIERMSYGPDAIAYASDGKVLFVAGGVPGEECCAQITKDNGTFAHAKVVEVLSKSAYRVDSKCSASSMECGGCSWASLSYDMQLQEKRCCVLSSLVHIAHVPEDIAENIVLQTLPSKHVWAYRNKIEMQAHMDEHGKFQLGFTPTQTYGNQLPCSKKTTENTKQMMATDVHEKTCDNSQTNIRTNSRAHSQAQSSENSCLICPKTCAVAAKKMQKMPQALRGALRYIQRCDDFNIFRVGIRASNRTGNLQVAIWTLPGPCARSKVARVIQDATDADSVVRVMAQAGKSRKIKGIEVLAGSGHWEEMLLGEKFSISAPSFFQVNTPQAENMISVVMGLLCVNANEKYDANLNCFVEHFQEKKFGIDLFPDLSQMNIADLYSGAGTFTIPLALCGANVVAVESASSSVRDLRHNAHIAQVDIDIRGGDAAREIKSLKKIDAIVVDPPRAGLDKSMPKSMADANPKKIIYVSCNPTTLARDIARFNKFGYEPKIVQPLDMFPQTYHVETVVLLSR